jgi:hypothetical protein
MCLPVSWSPLTGLCSRGDYGELVLVSPHMLDANSMKRLGESALPARLGSVPACERDSLLHSLHLESGFLCVCLYRQELFLYSSFFVFTWLHMSVHPCSEFDLPDIFFNFCFGIWKLPLVFVVIPTLGRYCLHRLKLCRESLLGLPT